MTKMGFVLLVNYGSLGRIRNMMIPKPIKTKFTEDTKNSAWKKLQPETDFRAYLILVKAQFIDAKVSIFRKSKQTSFNVITTNDLLENVCSMYFEITVRKKFMTKFNYSASFEKHLKEQRLLKSFPYDNIKTGKDFPNLNIESEWQKSSKTLIFESQEGDSADIYQRGSFQSNEK